MFFSTIEDRLKKEKYESPFAFHADVSLSLANCQMYNPVNDPFRKMGDAVRSDRNWNWAVGPDDLPSGKLVAPGAPLRSQPEGQSSCHPSVVFAGRCHVQEDVGCGQLL